MTIFGSELRELLRSIPKSEIKGLFENLRQREYATLISLDKDGLTALPSRVKLLNELEHQFLNIEPSK